MERRVTPSTVPGCRMLHFWLAAPNESVYDDRTRLAYCRCF